MSHVTSPPSQEHRARAPLMRVEAATVAFALLFFCFCELHATADDAETYQVAVGALKDRLWQTAAEQFRALLRDWPHSGYAQSARYYLGFCSFQLQDFKGAEGHLRSYLSKWPRGEFASSAKYYLGRSLLESGRPKDARPLLRAVASGKGDLVVPAKFWLGRALLRMAQWSQAAKLYREVIESGDTRYVASAIYELGKAYAIGEQYAKSLEIIKPLLKQTKDAPLRLKARLLLADDLLSLKKYREALNEARKIIDAVPASSPLRLKALALQAESLRLSGDQKAAIEVFRKYLKESPDEQDAAWAAQNVIECLLSLGNCQEASQMMLLWAKRFSQDLLSDAGVRIASCYSDSGDEASAIKTLEFVLNRLRAERAKLPVAIKLADSYFRSGEFARVVLLLSPILGRGILSQERDVAAAALLLVAASHERLRSFDEAKSAYRLLLSLDTGRELRWDAALRLSNLLIELGELEEAERLLRELLSEAPLDGRFAKIVAKLVEALQRRGRSRDAFSVAREVVGRLWSSKGGKKHAEMGVEDAFLTALSGCYLCDIILEIAKAPPSDSDTGLRARLLLEAGECWFASGKDASASTIYTRFLREFPQSPDLYVVFSRLGTIAFRAGNFAQAHELFESAARKAQPSKACELRYMACESLFRMGKLDEALRGFEQVIASGHCPGRVIQNSYLRCGMISEEFGDFKKARSAYSACASMGFDETAALLGRARLRRLGG